MKIGAMSKTTFDNARKNAKPPNADIKKLGDQLSAQYADFINAGLMELNYSWYPAETHHGYFTKQTEPAATLLKMKFPFSEGNQRFRLYKADRQRKFTFWEYQEGGINVRGTFPETAALIKDKAEKHTNIQALQQIIASFSEMLGETDPNDIEAIKGHSRNIGIIGELIRKISQTSEDLVADGFTEQTPD